MQNRLKTKCLRCGRNMFVTYEGDGYFFGYDTQYSRDSYDNCPHAIYGYYCEKCGKLLEDKAQKIGYERLE
jgi:DNA-directed RNA polymerase subunit RPC12/RpoP